MSRIKRICISINNTCNLACSYCHFRDKKKIVPETMDVFAILDHINEYTSESFKIGFVGNGEPFLDWPALRSYLVYLEKMPQVSSYTITNGTIDLSDDDWRFLDEHHVNVGFSIDGYKELHDMYRCNSFDRAMSVVEHYYMVTGHYPTFNATVGQESLKNADKVVDFFTRFGTRITFSRMIGRMGVSLNQYRGFLDYAEKRLWIRRGNLDCTMYGGKCGAGLNNFYFANGKVFLCGNCVDMKPVGDSSISFFDLEKIQLDFDRNHCYKESTAY